MVPFNRKWLAYYGDVRIRAFLYGLGLYVNPNNEIDWLLPDYLNIAGAAMIGDFQDDHEQSGAYLEKRSENRFG